MSYAMRFNISIAIVSMVNQTFIEDYKKQHATDANFTGDASQTCGHLKSEDIFDENGTIVDDGSQEAEGEFNWDPYEQGIILGSFFWGYVLVGFFIV
jgi:hypothetical protein